MTDQIVSRMAAGDGAAPHLLNQCDVVGYLVAQPHQSDPVVVHALAATGRYRAQGHRLLLQVTEEDGLVYTLPLDVLAGDAEHQALIAALQVGDRVQVTGRVRMERTFDRRFATTDTPDGRPTMHLTVAVAHLAPAPAAAIDGSWVQLIGRISVPPTIRRHEHLPDEQIGRTALVVDWSEPSRRPGSRVTISRTDRIPLDLPLQIDGSAYGLRAGNQVRIEGRLEPFRRTLHPERNPFVAQHRAALDAHWQAEAVPRTIAAQVQQQRERVQHLRRVQFEHGLRVRAGHVDGLAGAPMTIADAQAAHAAFVTAQKQRRKEADVP